MDMRFRITLSTGLGPECGRVAPTRRTVVMPTTASAAYGFALAGSTSRISLSTCGRVRAVPIRWNAKTTRKGTALRTVVGLVAQISHSIGESSRTTPAATQVWLMSATRTVSRAMKHDLILSMCATSSVGSEARRKPLTNAIGSSTCSSRIETLRLRRSATPKRFGVLPPRELEESRSTAMVDSLLGQLSTGSGITWATSRR